MRTSCDNNPQKPQQSVPLFGGPKTSFSSPGAGAGFALTTDNQSPANFSYSLPGTPGTTTPSALLQKVGSQSEQSTAASEQISRPTPHMESPPIILNIPPVPITAPQLSRPAVMGDNVAGQNTGREESTADSVVCVAAIRDETFTFHKEMTDLLASVSALDCKIGQEEEMFVLLEKPEMLLEFFRELKETTVAQSSEIHELKTIMVEAFAWLEDARSKLNLLNNPSYIQLTRSQALDPISSKYAEDIRRMRYYIESQLHEINNTLDSKWARFQDSRKDGTKKKLQVPCLEVVYSTMVMHSNILKKQKQLLEGLLARLPETTRKQIGPVPLVLGVSLSQEKDESESELSKLAETLVEMKLNPSDGGGNSLKLDQLFVTNISRKQLSFTKQAKLRELFDQHKVVHICPTKPASVNFPLAAALSCISSTQDLAAAFPVSSVKPGGITTGQPIVKKNTPPHQAFPINVSLQNSLAPKLSSTTTIAFSADKDTPIVVTTSKPESVESLFVFGQSKVASQLEGIENKKTGVAEGINFQKFKFPVESNENEAASFHAKPGLSPSLFGPSKNFTENPSFKQSGSFSIDSSSKEASGKKKEGEFTFSTPTPSKSLISKPSPVTVPKVDEQQTKQAESISFTSFQEPGKRKDVFSTETSEFTISSSKMEPPRVEEQATPLQKSPLMSLGNIVASIGNDKTTNKDSEKTSEIFGKVSGSVKSPETFKFSLGGSFGGLLSSPSVPTVISADTGKESSPKSSSSSPGVNLKTPLLSFGGNNTRDLPPATSIFGGGGDKSQKTVTSLSGNIFGSGSSFNFGNLMKSPSSTNLFGAVTSTSDAVSASSKQSQETNSDEESITRTPPKEDNSAASKENQLPTSAVVTSPEITLNQPFFNNLSFGRSSDNIAPSNLFSGGISTPSTTFSFSKSSSSPSSPQQQEQEEENDNKENTSSTAILGSVAASNSTTAQETKVSPADASQSTFSFASLTTTLIPSTSESQPSSTGVETKPAPGSIFGGSLSATTSAQASSASFSFALPPASTTSAFGLKSPNMFALTSTPSTVTTTSSTSSFFSQPICSPSTFGQSGGSIFGQATTGSTLFGQTSTTTNTSLFGQTTTTTSSIFGQLAITSPSLFGQTGTTPSFGQAPSTTIASMFGQTQTTTASAFGQTSSTTSALPFGQTAPTTSTSIFGMKQSSNSSIFGQNQTSSGSAAFGNTSSAFGQTSSTESSVFGQSPTNTTSFFGAGAGAFGAKSMFEQSGGSIFGQNTSKPAFGSSGGSLFGGGASLFGSSGAAVTPSGNLFQSSGGSSLFGGSTTGGSPGGSGAFSSGVGGSIIQTGFGAGSFSQSKPGGFGSPPAFGQSGGSTPGFGAPATFGASPTFGGAPTFGSPAKIFGNSSPTGGFGSPASPQQSTAFENLATQNTMTFGNLAQTQGQNPGFVPPNQNVFGTAPASQPAFQSQGSSSFGEAQHKQKKAVLQHQRYITSVGPSRAKAPFTPATHPGSSTSPQSGLLPFMPSLDYGVVKRDFIPSPSLVTRRVEDGPQKGQF
uniref:Nuclear pore complex protein n=1 Tax=Timema monikensis TaxID=170555 RepID=A0A7R9HT32_9NEOP|nr:unnamed protein product [Timema monikensis]